MMGPGHEFLEAFADIGRDLFLSGLVGSHSGNLSVRERGRIIITRRGARLGRIREGDLVEFDLSNPSIPHTASSEAALHAAIYAGTSHRALVHCHPPLAISLSLVSAEPSLRPISLEAAHYLAEVPIIDAPAGEAAVHVAPDLARRLLVSRIVIARGHGTYAAGDSIDEAFQWTSVLEDACKISIATRAAAAAARTALASDRS